MSSNRNFPITYEERVEIQKHLDAGKKREEIAILIKRSTNGVNAEIRRNGGPKEYNAIKAQARSENKREASYRNLSQFNEKQKENTLTKRVQNLEMQIEILHDCVKELMR